MAIIDAGDSIAIHNNHLTTPNESIKLDDPINSRRSSLPAKTHLSARHAPLLCIKNSRAELHLSELSNRYARRNHISFRTAAIHFYPFTFKHL